VIRLRQSFKSLAASLGLLLMVSVLVAACQAAAAPLETPVAKAPAATSKLIVSADIVQGSQNLTKDLQASNSCVLSSRFPKNSEMVWRARVYDPNTGNLMTQAQLSKVEIKLANGKAINMAFGPHPKNPPGEAYWTGSWVVPKDSPTGTLNYTIVATSTDGRTGEFKPIAVAASLPTITDQTLPDVAQGTSG